MAAVFWSFTLIVTVSPIVAEVPVDTVTDMMDMLGVPGMTVNVRVWVMPPPIAVTVTVELLDVVASRDTVRIDVTFAAGITATLAGLNVAVAPVAVMDAVRLTVPAKPLTPFSVIVEVPVLPGVTIIGLGFAFIEKSMTPKLTVTVCDRLPLTPVMVATKAVMVPPVLVHPS